MYPTISSPSASSNPSVTVNWRLSPYRGCPVWKVAASSFRYHQPPAPASNRMTRSVAMVVPSLYQTVREANGAALILIALATVSTTSDSSASSRISASNTSASRTSSLSISAMNAESSSSSSRMRTASSSVSDSNSRSIRSAFLPLIGKPNSLSRSFSLTTVMAESSSSSIGHPHRGWRWLSLSTSSLNE